MLLLQDRMYVTGVLNMKIFNKKVIGYLMLAFFSFIILIIISTNIGLKEALKYLIFSILLTSILVIGLNLIFKD